MNRARKYAVVRLHLCKELFRIVASHTSVLLQNLENFEQGAFLPACQIP